MIAIQTIASLIDGRTKRWLRISIAAVQQWVIAVLDQSQRSNHNRSF